MILQRYQSGSQVGPYLDRRRNLEHVSTHLAVITSEESSESVQRIMMDNRKLSNNKISGIITMCFEIIEDILHNEPGPWKVSARWRPRLLRCITERKLYYANQIPFVSTNIYLSNMGFIFIALSPK